MRSQFAVAMGPSLLECSRSASTTAHVSLCGSPDGSASFAAAINARTVFEAKSSVEHSESSCHVERLGGISLQIFLHPFDGRARCLIETNLLVQLPLLAKPGILLE